MGTGWCSSKEGRYPSPSGHHDFLHDRGGCSYEDLPKEPGEKTQISTQLVYIRYVSLERAHRRCANNSVSFLRIEDLDLHPPYRICIKPSECSTCHRGTNIRRSGSGNPVYNQPHLHDASRQVAPSISGLASCLLYRLQDYVRPHYGHDHYSHLSHRTQLQHPRRGCQGY